MSHILTKTTSEKILKFLKPMVVPTIIGAVYVLTHTIWEAIFTVSVVDFILSHIEKNILNDTIVITAATVFVIWLFYKFLYKKHKPPLRLLSIIFIITAIYSYYRFLGSVWYFTSFSIYENVKYADVIFTLLLIVPFLVVQSWRKWSREKARLADNNLTTGFLYDEPISGEENQDKFGYEFYAKTIAEKLMATHSKEDKAFAMGINGKWGSGKTSFVTLIKKYLIKDHFIEIEFNPWNSHTPKAIIEDFFDTLEEGLMNHHWGTAKLIRSYSKKLIELNDSALTRGIQLSSSYLFGDGSLGSIQQKIKESQLFDKKIIVYIDDLDRLDQTEIIEVMRLIRNTANFKNMFFVVCYDRNYILNALKDLNIQHERFLEKIFQLEVTLPRLEPSRLRKQLYEGLKMIYPKEYHEIIEKTTIKSIGLHDHYLETLDKWLVTMRDVTLLINSLSLNSSNLLGDFYFPDLLKIELLRLRYPGVYELLHKKTSDYLVTERGDVSSKGEYVLKKDKDKKITLENDLNYLPELDKSLIMESLIKIFNKNNRYPSEDPHELSIVFPSKFYNYFSFGISERKLSNKDFINASNLNITDFKAKIDEWIKNGLEYDLVSRLNLINDYDNKEHFEQTIEVIFYLANKTTNYPETNFHYRKLISYPSMELFQKQLFNSNDKISNFYEDKDDWKVFINRFFKNAQTPYYFEAELLHYFINNCQYPHFIPNLPFTLVEGHSLLEYYFKQYIGSISKIADDHNIWRLYHACKSKIIKENNTTKYLVSNAVKSAFIECIQQKDVDGFIKAILIKDPRSDFYGITKEVISIFENWDHFMAFLEEQPDGKWNYLKEFLAFCSRRNASNFSDYIEYAFETIPVKDWFKN